MWYVFLLVAFLEGFTTLAFQMVALRKAIPYVGSSIVLTSVVIGVILLALSAWYYMGWSLTSRLSQTQLLRRLHIYLLVSALYYLLIVYPSFEVVLWWWLQHIWFVPTLFLFATVFFAIPTFLASHTMPIITHITQWSKWYAAWKILFISTLGSFLGSTMTTLVLFPYIGVYWTGIVASEILILCALLVYGWTRSEKLGYMIGIFFFVIAATMARPHVLWYYKETPYQTIKVVNDKLYKNEPVRLLEMNGGMASGIYTDTWKSLFPYIRQMVEVIQEKKPATIAVIWAAWCTLPQEIAWLDFVQHIDVVDIDPAVFAIAEKEFLQQPLSPKITPIAQSARGWLYDLHKSNKKYDLIVVDVYNGISLPDEVLTQEFFVSLQQVSDTVMMNIITDVWFTSSFSQTLFATMQSVFWQLYVLDANYQNKNIGDIGNFVVMNTPASWFDTLQQMNTPILFTDDKNPADEMRVRVMFEKK